jgi:hypothetical protein
MNVRIPKIKFDYDGDRTLKRWRAPREITPETVSQALSVGIQALAKRRADRYNWRAETVAKGVLQFLENVMIQAHAELPRDKALELEDAISDGLADMYNDMEAIQEARESYGMNRKMNKKSTQLAG